MKKKKKKKIIIFFFFEATPGLGYTSPIYGEILEGMIKKGKVLSIPNSYSLTPLVETDILFVVKSEAINSLEETSTPTEVFRALKGVYAGIELAATGTATLPEAFGKANGGKEILRATNAGARIYLRSRKMVRFTFDSRSESEWVQVLNGGYDQFDQLFKPSSTQDFTSTASNQLDYLLALVLKLKSLGISLKEGDLLSGG